MNLNNRTSNHSAIFDESDKKSITSNSEPGSWVKKWASETSMHGVAALATSTSTPKKVIWLLILLGALGGSSYYIFTRVKDYTQFNASSVYRITTNLNRELEFPAITICNYNMFYSISNDKGRQLKQ